MLLRRIESGVRTTQAILTLAMALAWDRMVVCAEDLATISGKVLKEIEIQELGHDSITVRHRDGVDRILLQDLSNETQKRFSPSELWKELRRKVEEIEKLKGELAAARGEVQKLNRSGELPIGRHSATAAHTDQRPTKPRPSISSLPALKASDVVPADEIAHYYSTDARSADLRFLKKTFRVQGRIERFEERGFVRKTIVILNSPEKSQRIVCELPYPDEFSAVFSTKEGQVLVGVASSRREVRLMEIGESVVIQGRCAGLQRRGIVFDRCERVK